MPSPLLRAILFPALIIASALFLLTIFDKTTLSVILIGFGYLWVGGGVYSFISWSASGPRGLIFNPGRTLSPFFWIAGWPLLLLLVYCRAYWEDWKDRNSF